MLLQQRFLKIQEKCIIFPYKNESGLHLKLACFFLQRTNGRAKARNSSETVGTPAPRGQVEGAANAVNAEGVEGNFFINMVQYPYGSSFQNVPSSK